MRTVMLSVALGLAVVALGAVVAAQEPAAGPRPAPPGPPRPMMGPPPGERGPMGPGGPMGRGAMEDKEIRELVETVKMVRLSRELGLNDEQTVVLVGKYNKLRERFQQMNRERQELMRNLKETARSGAADDQVQAALDKLVAHDREVFELRQGALNDIGKDLSAKQRARLYVFMSEFEQDMRRMIEKAREAGGGRMMRFREMRENMPNRPGMPPEGGQGDMGRGRPGPGPGGEFRLPMGRRPGAPAERPLPPRDGEQPAPPPSAEGAPSAP